MTQSDNNQPSSTPIVVQPSPADLPGARKETIPAVVDSQSKSPQGNQVTVPPPQQTPPQQQPQSQQLQSPEDQSQQQNPQQPTDTVEMSRFKAVQQIARQNEEDARAYRQLMESLGVKPEEKKNFDPQAEITKLRTDFEESERARVREQIAHTTNVPVDQIHGQTPEEMQASAQNALNWVSGLLQKAQVPQAVPASVVNSPAGPNDGGPQQITTRDELAKMSNADRMKAYQEGRLDSMLGKR